jgi:hypothetical protein
VKKLSRREFAVPPPRRFTNAKDALAVYARLHRAGEDPPLGTTNAQRLRQLAALMQADGRIKTLDALQALFNKTDAAAEASLRKLASLLNAAQDADAPMLLLNLGGKEPLAQRYCWLEGDAPYRDDARQQLAQQTQGETKRVTPFPAAQDATPLQNLPIPIRFFVSYAHADNEGSEKERLVDRLMQEMMPVLRGFGSRNGYSIKDWKDEQIICDGPGWHAQIQAAIREAHFGLLLVTHHFLDRDYIVQQELPHFLPESADSEQVDGRWMVGVQLKALRWGAVGKLNERQLFAYKVGGRPQSYKNCRKKENFAHALAEAIHRSILRRLPQLVAAGRGDSAGKLDERGAGKLSSSKLDERAEKRAARRIADWDGGYDPKLSGYQADTDAAPTPIQNNKDAQAADRSAARPAADLLDAWFDDPAGAPYFALLGDTGTGKTTQCQLLALRLNARWKADPQQPQCVYLDLRNVGSDIHAHRSDLGALLNRLLRQRWSGDGEPPTAEDVLRVVRHEGALLIWDGLDEVGVHLTNADQLNQLMNTLWSVLPSPERQADGRYRIPGPQSGRILISCRSQFFREARLQNQVMLGLGREGLEEKCFAGATLLPLTDAQVRRYFAACLPDQNIEAVMQMIGSVHNLTELSQRPLTLNLIREQIPDLHQAQLQGEKINGVRLYQNFVNSWLHRDTGKHSFEPRHKQALMQALAAQLWRHSARQWSVDELDDWLVDALEEDPRLARHYPNKELETQKADLRTATFVQRVGENQYRFAHTSLLEFFLAGYLLAALTQDRPARWALPTPSLESWDFFAQHLQRLPPADQAPLLARLTAWGQGHDRAVSENLWRYAVRAVERGWPLPSLRGLRLPDLQADGLRLHASAQRPLDLRGAVMPGLSLHGGWLRHVRWQDANLDGANFTELNLEHCDLSAASLRRARLQRGRWQDCAIPGVVLADADAEHCLWLNAPGTPAVPAARGPLSNSGNAPSAAKLERVHGHKSGVWACALSADGTRLFSGAGDRTLKAWDVASGACLATFDGHEDGVRACALSADGTRLFSGAEDGRLKAWDVASGACLATFDGHEGGVWACALSADGTRLFSGATDGTLKAWDVASGACLATFQGHKGWVFACALSADGTRLFSGGYDRTLKAWDVASGQELQRWELAEDGSWAAFRGDTVLLSRGEAWRWLRWALSDPATGAKTYLPAEVFGPLPEQADH